MSIAQKILHKEGEDLTKAHSCKAIVIACIDFRFQKFLRKFEDEHVIGGYDLMGFAGGVKNLDLVMEEINISKKLHNIHEVYLVNHEECGAYGEDSTYENHTKDLKEAKKMIAAKYSDLAVYTYYLHLNGEFEEIN